MEEIFFFRRRHDLQRFSHTESRLVYSSKALSIRVDSSNAQILPRELAYRGPIFAANNLPRWSKAQAHAYITSRITCIAPCTQQSPLTVHPDKDGWHSVLGSWNGTDVGSETASEVNEANSQNDIAIPIAPVNPPRNARPGLPIFCKYSKCSGNRLEIPLHPTLYPYPLHRTDMDRTRH
ncbi:hypothetical protein HOY82DRAFT_536345 [Tuber indicum]|nr:hypothetical protein HOY82DRAFT_536345 [Tuber indicum]